MSRTDCAIRTFDGMLRTLAGVRRPGRARPDERIRQAPLAAQERALSAALMRVNHVGEVCAQALYHGQALTERSDCNRQALERAAREEEDHLRWSAERIAELDGRPSLLNPLWYAGAFALGAAAGAAGDRWSLGFVAETERQVEEHLAGHLQRLPAEDRKTRAMVEAMRRDEAGHRDQALALGAAELPAPVRRGMRAMARLMTTIAYRL